MLMPRHDIKLTLILSQAIRDLPLVFRIGTWLLSRQESFLKQEALANLQTYLLITLSEKVFLMPSNAALHNTNKETNMLFINQKTL